TVATSMYLVASCLPSLHPHLVYLYLSATLRDLHSFPTRRSSDLVYPGQKTGAASAVDTVASEHRLIAQRENTAWKYRVTGRATSDRKSTRLNSSHQIISYAVFCLKKKRKI